MFSKFSFQPIRFFSISKRGQWIILPRSWQFIVWWWICLVQHIFDKGLSTRTETKSLITFYMNGEGWGRIIWFENSWDIVGIRRWTFSLRVNQNKLTRLLMWLGESLTNTKTCCTLRFGRRQSIANLLVVLPFVFCQSLFSSISKGSALLGNWGLLELC